MFYSANKSFLFAKSLKPIMTDCKDSLADDFIVT